MPFEVFRRHQRKLLAVLAIFAMVAFTLDFSLFRNMGRGQGENPVVFNLYGQPVRRDEVNRMRLERLRVNLFMGQIFRREEFFGGTTDEEIRDALILEHEADRLGMPATLDLAKQWLREQTGGALTPEFFDAIYRQNFTQQEPYRISDEQLLAEIANQIRIYQVRVLPGLGVDRDLSAMTPMDLFEAYRQQNERVSALLVAFPAEEFLGEVGEPTEAEVKAYYEKYKDALPDPDRDTPGFKTPRQVEVEYVMVDQEGLAEGYEESLTDEQLRAYYEAHKDDFRPQPPELPRDLFAGAPELTPHEEDPFAEARARVRTALADEKAREEVARIFDEVREEVMDPFLDRLDEAAQANDEAREAGRDTKPLPEPKADDGSTQLAALAKAKGLEYHATPPITREQAEDPETSPIARASAGGRLPGMGTKFADYVFQPRASVYEPFELSDERGRRFLAWKLADREPAVPPLAEVRDEVVRAWKLEKARAKAEAAAKALADKARAAGGDLSAAAAAEKRVVIPTDAVPEISPSFDLDNPATFGQLRPTEIPQLDRPGEKLREAYFALKKGDVQVAPNAPKTTYYVLALKERSAADVPQAIYNPMGARLDLEPSVAQREAVLRYIEWMEYLRKQAGVEVETPEDADSEA
jgi:peptidyl-prolyl cis-trans isomerase D